MIVMNDTNINFSAVSKDTQGNVLANMSASYSGGSAYFTMSVEKVDDQIDYDFVEFKSRVLASVASVAPSNTVVEEDAE